MKYCVPVNFTTTINIEVDVEDFDDVRDYAEFEASRVFSNLMTEGSLYPSDFTAEAQEV